MGYLCFEFEFPQANHIPGGQKAILGMATRANDGILALPNILRKSSAEEQKLSQLTSMNSQTTMGGSLRLRSNLSATPADHLCTALALRRRRRRCVTTISSQESRRHQFSHTITTDAVHTMRQHEVRCHRIRRLPPLSISSSSINNMIMPHHIQEVAEGTTRATLVKTFSNGLGQLHHPYSRSALAVRTRALHQP